MKQALSLAATTLAIGLSISITHPASASPYCSDLLSKEALAKKYKRLAPIYSDNDLGWIFTADQMKSRYEMKPEALTLFTSIMSEFRRHQVPVAIMMAPPRPVIAGQEIMNGTMGSGEHYDVAKAERSFNALIQSMQQAGAIVPNLSRLALSDQTLRRQFYFQRDTHWTTTGATQSAFELARGIDKALPGMFPGIAKIDETDLPTEGKIGEPGSLSEIVQKTCGTLPEPEYATAYDFNAINPMANGDLLGDIAPDVPRIALLGSSFSNRYKRDHYRVADALSAAFGAEVDNLSVSGGGMIGPIEAFVLQGGLREKHHDLIIWEVPYTESFNSVSALRQLLGALQMDRTQTVAVKKILPSGKAKSAPIALSRSEGAISMIAVETDTIKLRQINLDLQFADGSTKRVKLRRKDRMPPDRRSRTWAANLQGYPNGDIVRIALQYKGASMGTEDQMSVMTLK